ncbi:putative MFS transporter [Rhodoglobus vestalii]|uniref:Putative MFS transporter n=1 Tax=Rhodoglobus vestalii TaxID=193384 RepID=A0A8H2K7R5_9MICO|nr:MFS transporter [Rhodoglobus vestalii]TQO19577.1 putative MFS transporter [Rhodoglobus vestalii]
MSNILNSLPRESLTERLDRLPFTRRHRSLLAGSGVGWALDAFDVGLISFVIAQLSVTWKADAASLSWVAAAGFAGMAVGAALGGILADKLGRKQVFVLTLLLYGVATGASALAWSVGILLLLRFIVGLGLGAELPVVATLVSEFAPRRIRGRVVVLLEGFWAIGWLGAAVVGYLVIPASPDGWRLALLIGMLPAVWAVFVRLRMPESVRFLQSKGRHAEAESIVVQFEASAGIVSDVSGAVGAVDPTQGSLHAVVPEQRSRLADLFSGEWRRRSILIWLVWFLVNFSYYGAFIWLPTLLVGAGFPLVKSFEFTLIITLAQLPGYAASAYLVEKWGRRITLSTFLIGSAVSAVAFGFGAVNGSEAQIIGFGMLLSFFNLGAWGALYAITPELYPTRLRGSGTGAAAGFGRIASIAAPLLVPPLLGLGGPILLFVVFGIVFVLAAGVAFALPELGGKKLPE